MMNTNRLSQVAVRQKQSMVKDVLFAMLVVALMTFLIASFVQVPTVAAYSAETDAEPTLIQGDFPTEDCIAPADQKLAGMNDGMPLC